MKVDLAQVEDAAKELYIRALKALPPDIKRGFEALASAETDAGAKRMLGTMIRNISVAEGTSAAVGSAVAYIYNEGEAAAVPPPKAVIPPARPSAAATVAVQDRKSVV